MAKEELIKFFQEGMRRGFSIESLKEVLQKEGWPQDFILEAEVEIRNNMKLKSQTKPFKSLPETNHYDLSVKSKRPIGIVVISLIHWLIALSIIVQGILFTVSSSSFFSFFPSELLLTFSLGYLIISLVLSLLPILVGIGIWKGKIAWRTVAIVFGILFTLFGIFTVTTSGVIGITLLVISLYVVGYLLFSSQGKEYFKNGKH
ncbi:hypothetical protein GW932_05105 [archaeon]|nr:hypothetical protein [archaeon]